MGNTEAASSDQRTVELRSRTSGGTLHAPFAEYQSGDASGMAFAPRSRSSFGHSEGGSFSPTINR